MALNGGPEFKFSAGGQKVQCGWLKDKFGFSWQVVYAQTEKMLTDKDPEKRAYAGK